MLEIKNIVTKMKRVLDGLISRLNIAEKKISEFEDMTIHISKSEKQKEKNTGKKKKNRISKSCRQTTKGIK